MHFIWPFRSWIEILAICHKHKWSVEDICFQVGQWLGFIWCNIVKGPSACCRIGEQSRAVRSKQNKTQSWSGCWLAFWESANLLISSCLSKWFLAWISGEGRDEGSYSWVEKLPALFQKISPNLPPPRTLLTNRGQLSVTFIDYYHSKYITESFLHDREQDTKHVSRPL